MKNWFKELIGRLTRRQTALVLLELGFDSEPQAPSVGAIATIAETDDLDRRLAEAWAKSGCKPEPLPREQTVQDATARKAAIEEEWRNNGCYKDASGKWVVPDELMWRSLPRGEDR